MRSAPRTAQVLTKKDLVFYWGDRPEPLGKALIARRLYSELLSLSQLRLRLLAQNPAAANAILLTGDVRTYGLGTIVPYS